MKPLSAQQLLTLTNAASAPMDYSPLGDVPCVVLELSELASIVDKQPGLQRQPCPVIGIGTSADALASICDVLVSTRQEAGRLAQRIAAHPQAATVLVQVLRVTESLPVEQALIVESLAYATLQGGPEHQAWLAQYRPPPKRQADSGRAVELQRDDSTLNVTLNRPNAHNAMTVEMRDALTEALELALTDPEVGHIELRGRGRCFSTGGDLVEFGSLPDAATGHVVRSLALPGRLLARCASRATAYVHGACIGSGVEFPAFADHVVAAPGTHFQLPELALGLIPGAGGCVSIARRIGRQRTAWLVLSGRRLRVRDALEWGLVDAIEPDR